jgi:hypothetical protein
MGENKQVPRWKNDKPVLAEKVWYTLAGVSSAPRSERRAERGIQRYGLLYTPCLISRLPCILIVELVRISWECLFR